MKPANKAGKPAAERVERRAGAEGNAGELHTDRTQSRAPVGLWFARMRGAAPAALAPSPEAGAVCGVRQEDEQSSCCARDEGGPFGAARQGEASSRHELLQPKAAVVSVVEKAWQ